MKILQLEIEELETVSEIVKKYKNLDVDLTVIVKKLEELNASKNDVLSKVDEIKHEELLFLGKLKAKYGKGSLDLYTLKYVVQDD